MSLLSTAITTMAVLSGTPQQADRGLAEVTVALQGLRDSKTICLSTEGTDEIGNRPVQTRSDLYVQLYQGNVWMELISYESGRISNRMVADGTNFYRYNVPGREYSVAPYSGPAARRDSVPLNSLLQMASVHAKGGEAQMLRVLSETLNGSLPMMKSWMPGTNPYELQYGQTMDEPLVRGKSYRPRMGESVFVYQSPQKRSIAFWLGAGTNGNLNLNYIQWTERQGTTFRPRTIQWTMTFYRDADLKLANFRPWTSDQTRGWTAQATSRTSG